MNDNVALVSRHFDILIHWNFPRFVNNNVASISEIIVVLAFNLSVLNISL